MEEKREIARAVITRNAETRRMTKITTDPRWELRGRRFMTAVSIKSPAVCCSGFRGEFLRPWPRLSLHFCSLIVGRASRCANARFACTPRNAQFPESQITSSPANSFVKIAMHGTRILRCYPVVRRIVQRWIARILTPVLNKREKEKEEKNDFWENRQNTWRAGAVLLLFTINPCSWWRWFLNLSNKHLIGIRYRALKVGI